MSVSPDFRSWAARVANQAANERDDREVLRLMSIAVYWERLADLEDWQQHGIAASSAKTHQQASLSVVEGYTRNTVASG
jgi:hypothetical protein